MTAHSPTQNGAAPRAVDPKSAQSRGAGTPPDWFRRVWPAAAFHCALLCSVALLKSASNALVVARYHAESLPALYLVAAGLTAAGSALAAVTLRRQGQNPGSLAAMGAAVALAISGGLWAGWSATSLLLYLFAESFTTFVSIVFWSRMSDAFDARESRRAFTALAGFGMIGTTLGGLLAQGLAWRFGAVALVAAGGVLLIVATLLFRLHRSAHTQAGARKAVRHGEGRDVWTFMRTNPFPVAVGGLILTMSIISPFADFVFRERAARTLGEDELAAFFGSMQLGTGVLCAFFQLVVAQRLLSRVGIVRYLAVIPALLLPLTIASLLTSSLWPVWMLKLVESAVSLSILPVGVQLLYAPLPDDLRDKVRALMDGLVKKGGVAVGGILLFAAGPLLSGPTPAAMLIVLCLTAGVLLWRLRAAYISALQLSVGDAPAAEDDVLGGATLDLLRRELQAPSPEHVLHALSLLSQGGDSLRAHVPTLLQHPSDRVVQRGVQLALSEGAVESVPALEQLLSSGMRRPRTEAVWALAKLAPARAQELLPPLLSHPDPGVRGSAIGALLSLGEDVEAERALRSWIKMGDRAPLPERRELARLLGRLRDERWAAAVLQYLGDPEASVRNIAALSIGEGRYLSLAPALLPCLLWKGDRRVAREALSAFGDAIVPLLEEALNDRSRPAALRYQLPRVLRQMGTQAAFDAMLFSNVRDDAYLHYRIGVSLCLLKEERPELQADRAHVRDALSRRRELYRRLVDPYRDIRAALGEHSLLTRAVGDRLDQALEVSFWLLGLIHAPRSLRRMHAHIVGTDSRRRAYALELLENLVDETERDLVSEQVHAHHRELPPGAAGRLSDHLGYLCHSDDHVLRACARHIGRELGLWTLPPLENDMSEASMKRLFALEDVEIFAHSDVDDLAAVAEVTREHRFRAGERIYSEGDPGDALYVIVNGSVDALRHGEKVLTLNAKQVFGEVSLLDGAPRPTDMVAREDTSVLIIDQRDFLDLISDRPDLLKGIFRAVSRQLREVVELAANARKNTGEIPKTGGV